MRDKKSNASKDRMKENFDAMKSTKGKTGKSDRIQKGSITRGKQERPSEKDEDAKKKYGKGAGSKAEGRKEGSKSRGRQDRSVEKREGDKSKLREGFSNSSDRRKTGFKTKGKQETQGERREFPKNNPESGKYRSRRKNETAKTNMPKMNVDGSMRLNRYVSNAGVCSRREADEFIAAGLVSVNGTIVTELGIKVSLDDVVKFDGRTLNPEKKVYVLLNKPKNFVTSTDDPHADKTVMDLVKNACTERIYPVGRLDRNTTGVLLFTNDGDLSKRLTHPSYNHKKIYHVCLDKPVSKQHMIEIAAGIELEDGPISSDEIKYISMDDKTEIGIEIHSGRNRIVRRIFEHLGYHVKRLDRVYFAGLTKKNLPRGKWRLLDKQEVNFLKMNN